MLKLKVRKEPTWQNDDGGRKQVAVVAQGVHEEFIVLPVVFQTMLAGGGKRLRGARMMYIVGTVYTKTIGFGSWAGIMMDLWKEIQIKEVFSVRYCCYHGDASKIASVICGRRRLGSN